MLTAIQRASSPVRTLACRGRVSPTDGAAARTQRLMWRLMLAKKAANKRSQNGGTHMNSRPATTRARGLSTHFASIARLVAGP